VTDINDLMWAVEHAQESLGRVKTMLEKARKVDARAGSQVMGGITVTTPEQYLEKELGPDWRNVWSDAPGLKRRVRAVLRANGRNASTRKAREAPSVGMGMDDDGRQPGAED
jgi:hypothetical protein